MTNPTTYTYAATPLGDLLLAGAAGVVETISFPSGQKALQPNATWERRDDAFPQAKEQLAEYFAGRRCEFGFPIQPSGTRFQLQVLNALQRIPYGETRSYADIAEALGRPNAVRAVGAANGRNPLPIVIPCHRVIGKNGSLTGFGGGLDAKRFLLALEQGQALAA